jgi:hypothetical protein
VSGDELHGHWTLESWTGVDGDGRSVSHGGDEPRGDLIYLPSGRMAVQIQSDGRDPFGSRDLNAGSATERAIAYSTYNAYCGTFSVPEPGVVIHHVELSIHPDQPGMDKRRPYDLDGDVLTLHTQALETENGPATSELRWRRSDS